MNPHAHPHALVVFADIAGSTALYEQVGDIEAQQRISRCLEVVSGIIRENNGEIVKYIGDEILFYFLDCKQGITSCCEVLTAFRDHDILRESGLAMKIGFYAGPILFADRDIFGDTVNTAARMVSLAKANQVVCDKASIAGFGNAFQYRPITWLEVKGKAEPIQLCEVIWAPDDTDLTYLSPSRDLPNVSARHQWCMEFITPFETVELTHQQGSLTIGRVQPADICIDSPQVSRNHAKLVLRHRKAVLTDQSTNGTFVVNEGGDELYVHREEITLANRGVISLGLPVEENKDHQIRFVLKKAKVGRKVSSSLYSTQTT